MKTIALTLFLFLFIPNSSQADTDSIIQLAEQGEVEAQYALARAYENGDGVQQDFEQALKWYQKAADKEYAPALIDLGWFHQEGQGVPKDSAIAITYYQKAAAQNNALAMLNIGWIYDQGIGVKEDNKRAIEWYEKAADAGHENAQFNLGAMYAYGEETEKDYVKAIKWLSLVRMYASNNDTKWRARGILDEIKPHMTKEEQAAGIREANAWVNPGK